MDFYELALKARSCRRFVEDQPLGYADLDWLCACARLAPSGRNAQELRFIEIVEKETCAKVFAHTRWAGAIKDGIPKEGERPTAFIAVLMPEKSSEVLCFDMGIACQTIQLAATSRGWGCCMIYSYDHKEVADILNIPENLKPGLLLALGLALEERAVSNARAGDSLKYWRDDQGVHHVPKLELEDLVLKRF